MATSQKPSPVVCRRAQPARGGVAVPAKCLLFRDTQAAQDTEDRATG
jgi:hypothetical protein